MISLYQLLQNHLKDFHQHDAFNADNVETALKICPKEINNDDLLHWWQEQDIAWIVSLQSFVFWMWTTKRVEYQVFETTYDALNSPHSKSWNMPIEVTTGLDSPLLEGGFFNREFSILQYRFSPSNHDLVVTNQELPFSLKTIESLDIALDLLSFLLDKYSFGYLGFRQKPARKWQFFESKLIGGMLGPEIRQDILDFDFKQVEDIILRVESESGGADRSFSLTELLQVRHRSVLDSSLESKLVTLWSSIEALWGKEDEQDFLFSADEKDEISKALSFLGSKHSKVVELLGKMKSKTKNEKIIEEIQQLECVKGWEVDKTVKRIHDLRSKFVHGGILREKQVSEVIRLISFMMKILNELIAKKLLELNIEFGPVE
ncbi:MAG: hypothetical protein C4583_13495 [Anaerolineaceae bacterium]|nr:MAG: hypothetical protein C4583_13495 [Anaerolineaceae bacterium]